MAQGRAADLGRWSRGAWQGWWREGISETVAEWDVRDREVGEYCSRRVDHCRYVREGVCWGIVRLAARVSGAGGVCTCAHQR